MRKTYSLFEGMSEIHHKRVKRDSFSGETAIGAMQQFHDKLRPMVGGGGFPQSTCRPALQAKIEAAPAADVASTLLEIRDAVAALRDHVSGAAVAAEVLVS